MGRHSFSVDFSATTGTVRLYNSVNKAPAGNVLRLPGSFAALHPPLVRLHDVPFDTHGVVDVSYLFPCFHLDPDDPRNYRFGKTDGLLKTIIDAGSGIYFRLGESIEHSQTKYAVHPPDDFAKWARICVNIISHYRRGWAHGYEWPIEYWEIWNEPDMRPSCWTGTDRQYFDLYVTAAQAIKKAHPHVKVGGPVTYSPFHREFLDPFLSYCVQEKAMHEFARASARLRVTGNDETAGLALLAGISPARDEAALLLSNFAHAANSASINLRSLPWQCATAEMYLVDGEHSLARISSETVDPSSLLTITPIEAPSVCLIKLKAA